MSRNGFGIRFRTGAVTVRGRVSGFYPLLNPLLGGDFGGAVPQAVGEMGLPAVSRGRYGLPPVRKIERETKRRYAMKKFNEIGDPNDAKMPLSAKNYVLLLVGAAVILLGGAQTEFVRTFPNTNLMANLCAVPYLKATLQPGTHILVDAFYARPADADERGGFAVKPFAACKGDAIEISCADGRTIRIDLEG